MKAIFFDLFFTLIVPEYGKADREFDILGLPVREWEKYAEDASLYQERALGLVQSETEIIEKIVANIPFAVNDMQKEKILAAREQRMKKALHNISEDIIDVLEKLQSQNIKIGLISNADIIDCKYWMQSKLFPFFDDAIFSCHVGLLKPDKQIYELAMRRLNVSPDECLYVGDGGSEELYGAKSAGMKTVFTEALVSKSSETRNRIMAYADHHINTFAEILKCW